MVKLKKVPQVHHDHGGLSFIDIARAKLSRERFLGFLQGNVLKYILRYQYKGSPIKDLEKCLTYLEWLKQMESEVAQGMAVPAKYVRGSSAVEQRPHTPKVSGSNPDPATSSLRRRKR